MKRLFSLILCLAMLVSLMPNMAFAEDDTTGEETTVTEEAPADENPAEADETPADEEPSADDETPAEEGPAADDETPAEEEPSDEEAPLKTRRSLPKVKRTSKLRRKQAATAAAV